MNSTTRTIIPAALVVACLWWIAKAGNEPVVGAASQPVVAAASQPAGPGIQALPGIRQTVDTSAVAPPAAAPSIPPSFDSSRDVWAYAQAVLASDNESRVYEGYRAARECAGFGRSWLDYASFSGGGKSRVQGELTPARQLAIQGLQQRCSGFIAAGNAESRQLVQALDARITALGRSLPDAYRKLDHDIADDASLQALLFSESPTAVEEGLMALSKYWDKAGKDDQGNAAAPDAEAQEQSRLLETAAFAAICDLGKDCGKDSYYGQLLCAMSGQCNAELWQDGSAELDPAQAQRAAAYRQRIVDAVQARNLEALKALK